MRNIYCLPLIISAVSFATDTVFTHTASTPSEPWIRPASLTKLALVHKALDTPLPQDFKTTAYLPHCHNGQCTQPIILSLGDPFLTSTQLDAFVKTLSQSIHTINSNIQVQYTPQDTFQTGLFHEERYECYSATPTGIDLDQNCITQEVFPHTQRLHIYGQAFSIMRHAQNHCPHQQDPSDFVQDKHRTAWVDASQNTFHLCDDHQTPWRLKSHVNHPKMRFKEVLSSALNKYHVQHQDIVFSNRLKQPLASSEMIISRTSLHELFTQILKQSNNFAAQFLHQYIGAPKLAPYLFDGSGLSRYNLIQPHTLNQTLKSLIEKHPWIKTHMLTEKNLGITLPPHVHLYYKTGTLFPVKNITGFIEGPEHSSLFFTLTCTHPQSQTCQKSHIHKINALISSRITPSDATSPKNVTIPSQIQDSAI